MLYKLVPITLIAAFGIGIGTAVLAETAVGTVAGVSAVCDTVTLTDGTTFAFDDEAYADRLTCFKPGDEVSVTWRHVGDKMEAIAISPVSAVLAQTGVGTVATVDAVCDTVTLTDGTTYVFDDEEYADRLHCFKPGDEVSITWHHVGDRMEASAISPVNAACVKQPDDRLHECTRTED